MMINKAFDLGKQRYPWWPDWKGQSVAIVGCGPSIKQTDLSVLQDRIHVLAIKEIVDKCPWAEVCYGCDAAWWLHRKGLPMHHVEIEISRDDILIEQPLHIGNGGCSGFQTINLVVQFGATDVILVGFDLHERGGLHWYGRNKWPNANNPSQSNFNRWNKGFTSAKPALYSLGVNVVNASLDSQLSCFPKQSLSEVMKEWGL
jgi:hypothetical protein